MVAAALLPQRVVAEVVSSYLAPVVGGIQVAAEYLVFRGTG